MTDKEKDIAKTPDWVLHPELRGGESKEEKDKVINSEGGLVEQLLLLLKLRLLKNNAKLENFDPKFIKEIEKGIASKEPAVKSKSINQLNDLLMRYEGVHKQSKEETLESLVKNAKSNDGNVALAGQLEARVVKLRKGEVDESRREEEAREIRKGLLGLGKEIGVLKDEDVRIGLEQKLASELLEVKEAERKLQMIKIVGDLGADKKGREKANNIREKALEFVEKEAEEPTYDDRLTKVVKGKDPHVVNAIQNAVDKLLADARKELLNPSDLAKLDEAKCIERILQINSLERQSWRMQGEDEVSQHLFELHMVYQDQLESLLQSEGVEGSEQFADVMREIWTKPKLPTKEEIQVKLESASKKMVEKGKKGKRSGGSEEGGLDLGGWDTKEDIVNYIINKLGGPQESRYGGRHQSVAEIYKILESKKTDILKVRSIFRSVNEDREKFNEMVERDYGFNAEQANLLFDSMSANRSYFNKEGLELMLTKKQYKQYTESIIEYLYTVGLREGMNDLELMRMMNEAKFTLADTNNDALLEVFKSFESMAFFHEKYFNLGAKEYGEILNHLGNGPLWVWLQEHANVLKQDVEGLRSGEKKTISVLEMHDMMQSALWAKELTYTAPIHETELYKKMIISHLLNNDEPCQIVDGVIKSMDGKVLGNMSDMVKVDGISKSLEVLAKDSMWKVGTAQDIWRLTGRNLNILDDIDIGKALGVNKGLLGIAKICRYSEQYEFLSSYQHDIAGADGFLYDYDWYKGTLAKGMKRMMEKAGVDEKTREKAVKIITTHIMNRRAVGAEEFKGSNLPMEEVRLLTRGSKKMTFEEAKEQYLTGLRKRGGKHVFDWDSLKEKDKDLYTMQINLLMEKWNENLFSESELEVLNALPWAEINKVYGKKIGKDNIGSTMNDYINNFSYAHASEYVAELRGTDMKDYGGYFVTMAEAVAGAIKGGLANGSAEALAKMIGAMETYHPYDKTGLNRLGLAMWRQVLDWRTWKPIRRVPKQSGGYVLPNGDLMVNKFGRWEKEMKTEYFPIRGSMMERYKYLRTWGADDVEYYMRYLVGKGIFSRADGDAELFKRQGPAALRWLRRAIILNDWDYFWVEMEKNWGKWTGDAMKYILSTK